MSIPSLRQQMINEALDYHMNMNHVVFNRERKHIEMAGQQTLDKKQSDIIIEGNIRDRISRIMTAIQKLVQTTQFTEGESSSAPTGPSSIYGYYDAGESKEPVPERESKEPDLKTSATQTDPDQIPFALDKTTIPGSSLRSKKYISDSIATILSEYNGLCDYIDLQGRQKAFSQSDIAGIDGLVKQLIDPLKSALVPAMAIKKSKSPESYAEYTRIYNVITSMIKKIEIGFPFQKVDSQMLTERVPLREDIITREEFDPFSEANEKYIGKLYKSLALEKADMIKKSLKETKSPLEREAIQTRIGAIDRQMDKLRNTQYLPEEEYITKISNISNDTHAFYTLISNADALGRSIEQELIDGNIQSIKQARNYIRSISTAKNYLSKQANILQNKAYRSEKLRATDKPLLERINGSLQRAEWLDGALGNTIIELEQAAQDIFTAIGERKKRDSEAAARFVRNFERSIGYVAPVAREEEIIPFRPEFDADVGPTTEEEKKDVLIREIIRRRPDSTFPVTYTNGTAGSLVVSSPEGINALKVQKLAWLKQAFTSRFGIPDRKGLIGEGKKKGGHVHKQEVFDDQAELEPYLTKHLRPSKYRRDVPPIESSSEESSGEEGEGSDMEIDEMRLGKGKKKKATRKQKEDIKVIMSLPTKEAAVLVEKKRGGAKKTMKPIHKPVISDSKADKDLWFM